MAHIRRLHHLPRIYYRQFLADNHSGWNPFGLQTLKLGMLALSPFGRQIVSSPCTGGCLSTLMNLLWILCGGIWISITHLLLGAVCCITLIGIPFGMQHFKMAGLALTPFGKTIV